MLIRRNKQEGFTLVELLVITPIIILAVAGTVALLINLVAENAITNAENAASAEVQNALNEIQNSLSSSSTLLTRDSDLNASDASKSDYPAGPASSEKPFAGAYIIGKTHDQVADGPAFIANDPNDCSSPDKVKNSIRPTNTIYFAQDTTSSKTDLKRRVITATSPAICGASIIRQSCKITSPPSGCAEDAILAKDVVRFQPRYYTSSGSEINDLSNLSNATAVSIELIIKRSVAGKDVVFKGYNRFSLLNT